LKDVINKKKANITPKQFIINNRTETNTSVISNKFNEYFTNIGNDLAKRIPSTNLDPLSYIQIDMQESMFTHHVECNEVEKIIQSLKNASAGHDGIQAKALKNTYSLYLQPLTHVLNLSLTQGFVPDCMKVARVIPLYKSGDAMQLSNYRPVSILPVFSKLLERLMYNRLISFINRHKILYKYQFGFRSNHSTNMALILLIDKIASAIEKGEFVVGLFLDFQKAFDTVNHTVLLNKLNTYGIRGTAYQWFEDYLKHRQQFVLFANTESKKSIIQCGVPQGSILGPLLFLLYINDLVQTSFSLMPILFADDTSIFLTGKSIANMINAMNNELKKIVDWLNANKLSLNVKKTHYMIFRSRRCNFVNNENLFINGVRIDMVDHTKFLGVTVDSVLSWQKHISLVKGKIARGLGIICKARKSLNDKSLLTLYYSMIYSHLTYCIEVWGNTFTTHINSLFRLQKKAVKLIKSVPIRSPTAPLFKELGLLMLPQIHLHCSLIFIFKFLNGILPEIFNDFFIKNSSVNARNTRQNDLLYLPQCRTSLYQRSIKVWGVKEWNKIGASLDRHCSIHTFRKRLKQ
jgi:hypothetical protein